MIYSFFALLAFLNVVLGNPLSGLTVSVSTLAGAPISTQLIPDFNTYTAVNYRYAAEIASNIPVNVQITWSGPSAIKYRNCGSFLTNPVYFTNNILNSDPSYCSFYTPNPVNAGESISLNGVIGINFVELSYIADNIAYNYVVNLFTADPANNQGTNMLTLNSNDAISTFNTPFTPQQSQYTISYTISQAVSAPTTVAVPFYFGAQKSVSTVFVQECTGISCASCSLSTTKTSIYGGGINFVQPINGQYDFPATLSTGLSSSNCVRFINQVNQGGTQNENTITVDLNVKNCGFYGSCAACTSDADCGWCLTSNFNLNGACQVGDATGSFTGTGCTPNSNINIVPRWIWTSSLCNVVIKGDPRISGLQGQDFQVHGTPDEYFNLVSTQALQVNSRFVFLSDAKCDNFTTCFSHPGTYIDEVGIMMGENKVRLVAGAIEEAARVFINGKEVMVSSKKHVAGKVTVTFSNSRRIVVKTPEYMMTVSQSDKFFNIESALLKTSLLDQGSKFTKLEGSYATEANTIMHGLIGQTWRNNVYAGEREYEGEVSDYQVADGIWGSDFKFNLYKN